MAKSVTIIELGRKPGHMGDMPVEKDMYYPTFTLSPEDPIEFPEGKFDAKVELRCTNRTVSEDENGNKRYSYTVEVCGIYPGFKKSNRSEEKLYEASEDEEGNDAASSLRDAMQSARNKKMEEDYSEED